jgi:hypothetical protein
MPQDAQYRYYSDPETRVDFDLPSAARTTTGTATAFSTGDVEVVQATLVVSAASGTTPTLDVRLETTVDGTNWDTVGSFPQQTTTQAGRGKVFAGLGTQARWAWTIGGTSPSFTFTVTNKGRR